MIGIGMFFVPLLIISIFLIVIFTVIKLPDIWKGKMTYNVKVKILIGYIGILFLVTVIYFSVVQSNFATEKKFVAPYIDHIVFAYEEGELTSEFIMDEWTVPLQDEELTVIVGNGEYYHLNSWIPIIVEERNDNEKSAEVTLYETPTTINGRDISKDVALLNVEVEGNAIVITEENDLTELYYHSIQNEMTVTQFRENHNRMLFDMDFDLHNGEQMIVLSVPKDVKPNIDEDLFYVEYK